MTVRDEIGMSTAASSGPTSPASARPAPSRLYTMEKPRLRQITANKISAVLIFPTNFAKHYLTGRAPVTIELIKNPAQSWHPALLEELMGAVVTGLNALRQTLALFSLCHSR